MNVKEKDDHLLLWDEIALPFNAPKVQGQWSEENIFSIAKAIRYAYETGPVIEAVQKRFPKAAENRMSAVIIILQELAQFYADEEHSVQYWIREGQAQLAEHINAMYFAQQIGNEK